MNRSLSLVSLIALCTVAARAQVSPLASKPNSSTYVSNPAPTPSARLTRSYAEFPLVFEANQGQGADARVRFLSHGPGYSVSLAANEVALTLAPPATPLGSFGPRLLFETLTRRFSAATTVALKLPGADAVAPMDGLEPQEATTNYFIGNDPAKWHTGVRSFRKVRGRNVYPGVDLVFYGTQRQLEYDFVIAPNADPNVIALQIAGARDTVIDPSGDLVLRTARGDVLMRRPHIYQDRDGERIGIDGGYYLARGNEVRFRIGEYDRSRELVIDPILSYSLAIGTGPSNDRFMDAALPFGITTDSAGNVYVSGTTCAANFPATPGGPPSPVGAGGGAACHDAFVTKINPSGTSLIYSTVIGGSSRDGAARLALDGTGAVFITGLTQSSDFPTTSGAYDRTFSGGTCFLTTCPDAYVAKLSPDGTQLVYSTYLGGSNIDIGVGIAVNSAGIAFVAGMTYSSNYPTTLNGMQTVFGGDHDAFVTALSSDGSALVFSSFFGGNDGDTAMGIALDAGGNLYVAGGSGSSNFRVTAGSPVAVGDDVFVAKISASGTLQYSRLLGGSRRDFATSIVIDSSGAAYLVGSTNSNNFPVTAGALQTSYGGGSVICFALTIDCGDAFVAKVDASGVLVWSTFLGGASNDGGFGIALDGSNSLWITGNTTSLGSADPLFPFTADAYATTGTTFVANLTNNGSQLTFSTALNPFSEGIGTAVTVDSAGNVYATGQAYVPSTTAGAYSTPNSTGYVVKLAPGTARPKVMLSTTTLTFPPDTLSARAIGSTSPAQQVTLTNTGDAPLLLAFEIIPAGLYPASGFSATDDCGSAVAVGASCSIQVTYHPMSRTDVRAILLLHDNAPDGPHSIALAGIPGIPELLISPDVVNFGGQATGTTSANVFVELKDLGLVPFTVSGVTFTGPNASDFSLAGHDCSTASTRCFLRFTFRPPTTGTRTATAIVASTEPGGPHLIELSGEGTNGPIASLSTKSVGFGTQAVGSSATQQLNLTNRGAAPLVLSQITASGDFSVNSTACGSQLPAGQLCILSVTFTPSSAGERTGTLRISDNAFDSPQDVTLNGYGVGAGPVLGYSVTVGGVAAPARPVPFGNVVVGLNAFGTVLIFNWGHAALNVSSISISGDFALPNLAAEQSACASIPADSDSNSCALTVVFSPSAAGTRPGALSITSNAPGSPHVLPLTGFGRNAGVVTMSPTFLAFGNQGIGTTSAPLSVGIGNAGSAPIAIGSLSTTGPFSATSDCDATVAVGGSCIIAVSFAPVAAGTSTGTLTISNTAVGGQQTVGLTGNGITGPAAALRPLALNFGSHAVATTSPAQSVTLINSGTALLTVHGVAATGDFSASTCPTTLSPGATCTIQVTFTPRAAGTRTGILTISHSGVSSPQIASLNGTGTGGGPTPPTTTNDAYSTPFQTRLVTSAPGVLGNDVNTVGDAMTALLVSTTSQGVLAFSPDGSFTYTPNAGFVGVDTFTYRAVNGIGQGNIGTATITVTAAATLNPPTGLHVSSLLGNVLTLRWDPSASGIPATAYVIEGGLSPGQVLASLPTGSAVPIFTVSAAAGAFYVRVHALNGANRSAPSNEIRVFIDVPQPPSPPTGLVGMVNGSTVALAWRNTFAGGAPTSLLLDVSGSLAVSLPMGLVDSFRFVGVPAGTYTLSLRAQNAAGISLPSNPITLRFPGACSGAPNAPANFLAYNVGRRLNLLWNPAATGPAPASFTVNATGAVTASVPTTARALSADVPPGTYSLSVTAVNECGAASTPVMTIVVP